MNSLQSRRKRSSSNDSCWNRKFKTPFSQASPSSNIPHIQLLSTCYLWFLALLTDCRGAGVRPLTRVSQKPLHGSRPNFVERYLSAISVDVFFSLFTNFDFQVFTIFFFVFVNMGPYGSQNSKRYFSHSFGPISTKLYDRYFSQGPI